MILGLQVVHVYLGTGVVPFTQIVATYGPPHAGIGHLLVKGTIQLETGTIHVEGVVPVLVIARDQGACPERCRCQWAAPVAHLQIVHWSL